MGATITDLQKVTATLKQLDKKGNLAPVDGVPVWVTDNSDMVALAPSADGMSCDVMAVGPLGTCNVQVTADADMGQGSQPIIGVGQVTVTGGQATTVTVDFGQPAEQETVPTP